MAENIAFGGQQMSKEEYEEWLRNNPQQQQPPTLQPPPKRPEITNPVDRIATDDVANFIEENLYVPLVDTVDNLLGDNRSTEQIRSDRKDLNTKVEEKKAATAKAISEAAYSNPLATTVTETVRAGLGGLEGFAEGVGETGEYVGDILGSPVAALRGDWKNVPWSDSYESSDWEFGLIKENKTWQGNLGRNMISMVLQMRQLARLNVGIGGGQSGISRLGTEALRGGIVDFFNDPGEGNLSNLLETGITNDDGSLMKYWNFLPGVGGKDLLKHPDFLFTQALKHKDEDNDLIRRLKNSVEGGVFGIAVDGLMETYGALRHGLRKGIDFQARTGKLGGEVAVDEAADYLWHGTSGSAASRIDQGGFRYSRGMNALVGEGVYFTGDQGYASLYAAESGKQGVLLGGTLPTDAKILDTTGLVRGTNLDEGVSFLEWLDIHLSIKPSDLASEVNEEFGETFYYLSRAQKAQLRDWVTSQGYAGIRFDPDFANKEFGEGSHATLETAIYDLDVANRLVGSRAGSINIEDTPGMVEARRRMRANPRNAEEIIEADWQGTLNRLGLEDTGENYAIDQLPFKDRAALRIDTQLKITGRNDGYAQAYKITPLLNGEEVHWSFQSTAGGKALDVSWTATGKLSGGAGARRVFRDFPRIISELPPGTVLANSPTADLISEASGAQQRRVAKALWPNEKFLTEEESLNLASDIWEQRKGTPPEDYDIFNEFRRKLEDSGEIPYTLERRIYKEEGDIDPDLYQTKPDPNLGDNIRARLYKQVGFSDPDDGGMQFGIVRATLNQNGQLLDPLPNGLRADNIEQRLDAARNSEVPDSTKRPGYSERKFQQDTQPPRGEEGATDPTERVGRTTEYSLDEAAVSQETKVFDQTLVGGSNPSVNDATVRRLNRMSQPELVEYIRVRSPQISIDEIARSIGKQPEEYIQKALLGLARFATDGKVDHLEKLSKKWRDVHRFDQEGIAILRILSMDISEQMYDLADYMLQLDGMDESLRNSSIQFLERAKVLMKLKKEASSNSGFGLLNWWRTEIPPNMYASIEKANKLIDEKFDRYLKIFEEGEPAGMLQIRDEFLDFARGTVATQGDPTQIAGFFSSMIRVGLRNANQAVINSWLSSPVSQARNIAGSAFVAIERPFATMAGHAFVGEWKEAKAAFSMLDSIHLSGLEALKVARKSLGSEVSIVEGNKLAEFIEYSSQTRRDLDNLQRIAANPAEKFVAKTFDAHYTLINMPWNTWPGRGLQSGDDFFKALTAQMDLRYQAALEADGHMFKNKGEQAEIYKKLVLEKLGPNGEILDEDMLYNAQDVTFQLELQGKMKAVANSLNAHPEMKQFVPFIRTPHNINVYGFQHMPGIARIIPEWKKIMESGTPQQKALHRGREAAGWVILTTGTAMALGGMLTGNGPADPELRRIWRQNNEPMSIKLGEDEDGNPIWASYKSIPGAEILFSAIADFAFYVDYLPDAEGMKWFNQFLFSLGNAITNRTTLAGLVELGGLLDTANWTPRGMERALADRADALIPTLGGSGLRRQVANAIAPGLYEYNSALDAVLGRITGGIFGRRTPQMDIFTGEQMVRGTEGWQNFVNPFRVVHKNAHPVTRKLEEFRYELNNGVVEMDQGIPLTVEEQGFIRANMFANGKLAKELEDLFDPTTRDGRRFKNYYDQWLEDKGTYKQKSRKQSAWYGMITNLIGEYKEDAVLELRKGTTEVSKEYNRRLDLEKQKTRTPQLTSALI